jgi:PhnB protein
MNFETIPFLSLNGQAANAISFYQKYLNANVLLKVTYKQLKKMDPNFRYPEGQDEYITHSVLELGRNKIMIAEEEQDTSRPWQLGNSSSLCIQSKDQETIENLYNSITRHKDVTVVVPYGPNAFSPGYAIIRDPFDVVIQFGVTRHDF